MSLEQKVDNQKRAHPYKGYSSPLECYLAHPELKDLTRTQLSKSERGLYRALLRANQIKFAIPVANENHIIAARKGGKKHTPTLSQSEHEKVVRIYKPCDRKASEASRRLHYCSHTIVRHWKKAGLKIRKRGQPKKS